MKISLLSEAKGEMPKRVFGRTGKWFSIVSLGGQGSLESHGDEENCYNIIRRAYELGIRYFDSSILYDGSLSYYSTALQGIREDIFLAIKTDKRDKSKAWKDVEKSFKILKVDSVELLQLHHLDSVDDIDKITKKGGALEALLEMKDEGLTKYIGITGHMHPSILLEAMKRYDFDSVLCPVNACDRNMKPPFIDTVVKEANKKDMAIIGMKAFAQGHIFYPHGIESAHEALTYALSQDISTLIIGFDTVEQLEEAVTIARGFKPMNKEQMRNTEEKTKSYRKRACFFRREYEGYSSKDQLGDPYTISYIKPRK